MKQKWTNDYKWDMNKIESAFDTKLRDEGFTILGVKQYMSKMEWLIEKDGVQLPYTIMAEATNFDLTWDVFMSTFDLYKKYQELKGGKIK